MIVGQQDRADPSRVPPGAASLWVECHCPARPRAAGPDWEARFADRMLDRLAEHAPGLREAVVDTTVTPPLGLEARDPNLLGGDVGGGSAAPDQLLVFRPVAGWSSYALPVRGLFMCGAASHPGGGCTACRAATRLRRAAPQPARPALSRLRGVGARLRGAGPRQCGSPSSPSTTR
jgi:phytoene dehydrogenase-like protein